MFEITKYQDMAKNSEDGEKLILDYQFTTAFAKLPARKKKAREASTKNYF